MLLPFTFAAAPAYHRHQPEQTALYAIVAEHYPRFVQEIVTCRGSSAGSYMPLLARMCRYITRPAISTKRLSVDSQGRVVYQYRHPFRDGSTHVVLEPLDFIASETRVRDRHRNLSGVRGKLRVIACIEDPQLIAKILGHVRSRAATAEAMARAPPGHPAEALKLV